MICFDATNEFYQIEVYTFSNFRRLFFIQVIYDWRKITMFSNICTSYPLTAWLTSCCRRLWLMWQQSFRMSWRSMLRPSSPLSSCSRSGHHPLQLQLFPDNRMLQHYGCSIIFKTFDIMFAVDGNFYLVKPWTTIIYYFYIEFCMFYNQIFYFWKFLFIWS